MSFEDFNRVNYKLISKMHRHASRVDSRSSVFRSSRRRPSSLRAEHFPDPLFGTSVNDTNEMASGNRGERATRQFSFMSAPEMPSESLIPHGTAGLRAFSSPDLPMSTHDPFDEDMQSLPELNFSKHGPLDEPDTRHSAKDIEPIPLKSIAIPGTRSLKGDGEKVQDAPAMKKDDSSTYPVRKPPVRLSQDLMECLGKMTYHSIADTSLFEPIPLSPHQEATNAKKLASTHGRGPSPPLETSMDDSEPAYEFAEG